jgi:hypothetical protein
MANRRVERYKHGWMKNPDFARCALLRAAQAVRLFAGRRFHLGGVHAEAAAAALSGTRALRPRLCPARGRPSRRGAQASLLIVLAQQTVKGRKRAAQGLPVVPERLPEVADLAGAAPAHFRHTRNTLLYPSVS